MFQAVGYHFNQLSLEEQMKGRATVNIALKPKKPHSKATSRRQHRINLSHLNNSEINTPVMSSGSVFIPTDDATSVRSRFGASTSN